MKKLTFFFTFLLASAAHAGGFQATTKGPVCTAASNNFVTAITVGGACTLAQPAFTNLSGSVAASQMPALTGDITTSAGAVATTLATVNSNVGTFGDSTHVAQVTVNGKGLVTAASSVALTATVVTAPPSVQKFTSAGSATYNKDYTFVISSGSATVGATYTNNAVTFTVHATVASATQVVMSGSGAPASSGTLTKASGTGDSTLTFSQVLAPLYIHVTMCGGGGGGGGLGSGSSNGGAGGDTVFSVMTAKGGTLGTSAGTGGVATTGSTLGSGPEGNLVEGAGGGNADGSVANTSGGAGGSSAFGGAGQGGIPGTVDATGATANSCSGGGGAENAAASGAGGGGAGAFIDANIYSPAATYSYTVGAFGTAGTGTRVGGAGSLGLIKVTEYYQ